MFITINISHSLGHGQEICLFRINKTDTNVFILYDCTKTSYQFYETFVDLLVWGSTGLGKTYAIASTSQYFHQYII